MSLLEHAGSWINLVRQDKVIHCYTTEDHSMKSTAQQSYHKVHLKIESVSEVFMELLEKKGKT